MEHYWILTFSTLAFVPWASAEEVVLMKTPSRNWVWDSFEVTMQHVTGVHFPPQWRYTGQTNRYTLCNVFRDTPQKPNNWLRSELIDAGEVQRLDVTVEYYTIPCSKHPSAAFCKDSFDVYVWESNKSVLPYQIPHPIYNNGSYRKFAAVGRPLDVRTTSTLRLLVTSRYIVLGFRDQGGCRTLYSVKVSYNVCPEDTLVDSLVSVTQTLAPSSDSEPIAVEGSCSADSVHVQGSLIVICESNGEWNTSRLEGRCACKEDMENKVGMCKACSDGTFNDGNGLNCTVLPSEPRDVNLEFVNQSSAVITWLSPAVTGTQTSVLYDVDCRNSCEYYGKDCVDDTCGSGVSYTLEALNMTQAVVTNLNSFLNYTCKIVAKNRVSEVAERKHRITANFASISFRTKGSVPGRPEVFIQQEEDAAVALSWKLKCKNGIIQEYLVSYFRVDDRSNAKTLTTKAITVRIERLAPGKTFEFQVFSVNNFGAGLPGIKTYKAPNDVSKFNNTIIAIAIVLGIVLLILLALLGVYVHRQRKRQNRLMQQLMQRVEELQAAGGNVSHNMGEFNMDAFAAPNVENTSDANHAEYMDVATLRSFELDRDDLRFVRLLGSGNFGEVFKATMRNETVAVKSLKETATAKDKVDMVTELNVMKGLKHHPHVLKLIGCCSLSDPILIVLEYLPYGDLLGYLRKSRGHSDSYNSGEKTPTSKLTAKDLLSFAWMIADGMKYLAKMKIVHRDLAARNILVGENKVCKISDFGLARDVNADIYVRTFQARLPVKWMPPESLFHGESSTMSDVWSYGIVLWEVFTIGDSPYPGVKARQVVSLLERGYRMPQPIHISTELFSIMSECWSEKPEDRPTFQWICTAVKRLIKDQKNYVNLDVYNDNDYVNFDMMDEIQ